MTAASTIRAVSVNHSTSAFCELMLRSLFAHHRDLDLALTVYDNDSQDDMQPLCAAAAGFGVNVATSGFSGKTLNNSHGDVLTRFVLEHPSCDYYLFLDADICFLEDDTIGRMRSELDGDPQLFGVGARQSFDGVLEIPEDSRNDIYSRRLHPCCALIRNSPMFRRVVADVGLSAVTRHHAAENRYLDTCEMMTMAMRTHGLLHRVTRPMVLHFFSVSYDARWMEAKIATRDRLLGHYRSATPESR